MDFKTNKFKVIVKTNSKDNSILSFENNTYRISLKAKPIDGEANLDLIKFLSKELKKKVRIVSGFRSKEKILEFI
ncbi:DUF167 domain-containing protein [Candidatus Woesearchaeota archaeon]|nr:DUF167 domain-containing protein [Candidatus Woesearchaeota archaeon]